MFDKRAIRVNKLADNHKTYFGDQEVDVEKKESLVAEVFHSVAKRYDLMNDLMSFGIHRYWKRFTLWQSNIRQDHVILDLAGGTGDLAFQFYQKIGMEGHITLCDINRSMLKEGKQKLINQGCLANIDYVQGNAEALPFKTNTFNLITIGFGLRNVTNQANALKAMYDCLKPGGKVMILEFSKPLLPLLRKAYDQYSFKVLPLMGQFVANDKDSYRYLAESIRKHPDQEQLKAIMQQSSFEDCHYYNLTGGIAALHIGYKF
jgi:demethylmenaquinone methyltransferase/2-methoxy-6-polyprenyl-1,4-benzoquinol methylase